MRADVACGRGDVLTAEPSEHKARYLQTVISFRSEVSYDGDNLRVI